MPQHPAPPARTRMVWAYASATTLLATLASIQAGHAQSAQVRCAAYTICPEVRFDSLLQTSADARHVDEQVNSTEAAALALAQRGGLNPDNAERLLGKLIIYDKTLSVNRNVACASCHSPGAGFTGGIGVLNRAEAALPGSTDQRSANRKPMSYAYAPFAPVLHYTAGKGFVGGNFWDMRATGMITGNPAGDQALDPPLDPNEMDMADPACVVYRVYRGPYRGLFEQVWGATSFAINWPADADRRCDTPLSSTAIHPTVLALSPADRARATTDYHEVGLSSAAHEAGISGFSSKFDAWQDGRASLTAQEQRGFALFTGTANCSQCHAAAGKHPLFTDFSAANIGTPRDADLPYLHENRADQYGFVANPAGPAYVDNGVGAFLAGPLNTNPEWKALAPRFVGTFQVPTTRDVGLRPYPAFSKDYTHNGFFKSLKEIVHFYNTRDVLARCASSESPGVGSTCWPGPEQPANENKTQVGNLGLSGNDEDAIVAFLETLSDGYQTGATP